MKNKTKLFGESGFNQFYSDLFGSRWEALKESFFQENQSVEYKIQNCESYFLDSASVFAALCLPLQDAQNILDLCAAPGGKTLVLASRMPEDAKLFSNERSTSRVSRLKKVVETCLPGQINERVKVSCSDGSTWCKRQSECFDRILLDAPCSSERHVIQDKKYLDSWSPSRIKTVSMEQWALLSSAYRLLEVGGILLYSTCALCPQENDEIIKINNTRVHTSRELGYEIMRSGYEPISITVIRNGKREVIENVQFPQTSSQGVVFGMADFSVFPEEKTFSTVVKNSFFTCTSTVKMIWDSLYDLVTGRYGMEQVSGPIGVTGAITQAAQSSAYQLFYLIAVIAMNLGVFNLLPIPALDGGSLLLLLVEMITRKKLPEKIETAIKAGGFAILMLIAILVTFKDVIYLFK